LRKLLLSLCLLAPALGAAPAPSDWVDPFIGTEGTGHVFPGASVPFGMVQPSPDSSDTGWAHAGGYQYRDSRLLGFSNTHVSGAGATEFGDVLLQPAGGTPWTAATTDFSGAYDKAGESAHPGWYGVTLPGHQVRVELTATPRVALHRYHFENSGMVQVLADLQHGLHDEGGQRIKASQVGLDAPARELSGTVSTHGFVDRDYSFVVRFDRAWEKAELLPARPGDRAPRYLLTFNLAGGRELEARVALSTVDVAGARLNLAEADGRDFGEVREDARRAWDALLGRAEIEAPEVQKRIFYTALYHALLHPSDIADRDGRVRGPTGKITAAPGGVYYSTLSLWDTFRGAFPLLTVLVPERIDGIVRTMLAHQQAEGVLPVWTAWGRESWCMIGNPALPVMADAVAGGFHGFDLPTALDAMVASATRPRPSAAASVQLDWGMYEKYGYLPFDLVSNESVSATIELGIGDDAIARVAAAAGRPGVAARFAARAQSYRRLLDPATKLARGRDSAGRWRTPFDPVTPTSPLNNPGDYTEGNAWQYTLSIALHDPAGLVAEIGGPGKFGDWLDELFRHPGLQPNFWLGQEAIIGQYAHGNEPSHHIAYLYAWTDRPGQGPERIRQIARSFYSDRPNGIIGNDDAGQMSAWYVLSTLGFYPVVPASGTFVPGCPLVKSAVLHLSPGRTLRIRTAGDDGAQGGRTTLNGQPVPPTSLRYQDLMQGGELVFTLGTKARH
jgi:predicted alpha-1,2-mannosidase